MILALQCQFRCHDRAWITSITGYDVHWITYIYIYNYSYNPGCRSIAAATTNSVTPRTKDKPSNCNTAAGTQEPTQLQAAVNRNRRQPNEPVRCQRK